MMMPRCGVADIINGTTSLRSGKKKHPHPHHTVAHYTFFPGNRKWPPSKYYLTYASADGTPDEAIGAVSNAFGTWAGNSQFSFVRVQNDERPDLTAGFHTGDHGNGAPFDGRGGTLAPCFCAIGWEVPLDGDETWAVGAVTGAYDMETVALHEIGHLLGLRHSSVEGAVKWPSISADYTQSLHADDVQGIKALYNT